MSVVQDVVAAGFRSLAGALAAGMLLMASAGSSAPLAAQETRPRAVSYDPALLQGLEYRSIGPSRGGRVTTVTGIPEEPGTFYMGATGGGVWKTTDYGNTWVNVSDGYFATPALGAIRAAPSNPDIVYAGTGSDGIRSNIITGLGMYRSTDAGNSWEFLGLREAGQIGAVEVHPNDPDRVYVAAIGHAFGKNPERGVFRTVDGGRSWEKVLFVSDSVGIVDLELNPSNPDEIYAAAWRAERKPWTIISGAQRDAGVGIYKSTDGGDTWRPINNGLPKSMIGKIDFAISPANPDRLYALVEAPADEEGLYRSDDRGESWRLVSQQEGLMNRPFYFTNIDVDPTDPDVLWVGNVRFYKSVDAGKSWEQVATPHADNHDLWINPNDPRIMVQGNDGGATVTLDGGETWSTQFNQPTAELYQVAVDNRFPYWVYAGQQDNSTIGVPSLQPTSASPDSPIANWIQIGGCETGPAVPKPDDWRIVYANCKGRFGRYSHITGQERQYYVGAEYMYGHNPKELKYRFQRTVPIHVSPHDPNVVYHASQYLHRTTDDGETWATISPDLTANQPEHQVVSGRPITRDVTGEEFFSTIYAVRESPLVRGVIWTGSNDGVVHVTRDNGETWTDVTPRGLPEDARIQSVEASPHDAAEAYIAAYRYLLDDWQPYIFRTTDYGRSWTRLTDGSNGIPANVPTRVVREDPEREGLLYAGTEFGMYVSFDEGTNWQPMQLDLPVTPVTDIVVHHDDLVLSTMGRGFWIMDDLAPLRQLTPELSAKQAHLFVPNEAYRMRYNAGSGGPADPEYPPVGANIDYWLAERPAGELRMEILDAQGRVIRSFSSEGSGETEVLVDEMRAPRMESVGTPRLPVGRGMHRFRWDLRHPGAWDDNARRSGQRGPMVLPGTYQVRLSTDGWSETRPLEVRVDPRVTEDGVTQEDLHAQLELNLQVRDLLTQVRLATTRTEGALQRDGAEQQRPALEEIHERLVTDESISYAQPMLADQVNYLYRMLTSADQRPGRDAYTRFAELQAEFEEIRGELDRVLGTSN